MSGTIRFYRNGDIIRAELKGIDAEVFTDENECGHITPEETWFIQYTAWLPELEVSQ